jgi:hypothetical protein
MRPMKLIARVTLVTSCLCLFTLRAHADDQLRYHEPAAGAAVGAACINVLALPLRLVATTGMAVLGGFTGFMLGGDRQSAWDVWDLGGGDQIVTPDMLTGRQGYRFTSFDPHP